MANSCCIFDPYFPPTPYSPVPILKQQVAAVSNTVTIQCLIALMLPTLFIPHGGGPLPLLGDPGHTGLVKFLKAVPSQIQPKPKAILLVSAHWEVRVPPAIIFNHPCMASVCSARRITVRPVSIIKWGLSLSVTASKHTHSSALGKQQQWAMWASNISEHFSVDCSSMFCLFDTAAGVRAAADFSTPPRPVL